MNQTLYLCLENSTISCKIPYIKYPFFEQGSYLSKVTALNNSYFDGMILIWKNVRHFLPGIQYVTWENINRWFCVLVKWIEEDYLSNIRLSCIMRFGSFKIISLPIQDFRTVPNWKFKFGAKVLIWIGAQKFFIFIILGRAPNQFDIGVVLRRWIFHIIHVRRKTILEIF